MWTEHYAACAFTPAALNRIWPKASSVRSWRRPNSSISPSRTSGTPSPNSRARCPTVSHRWRANPAGRRSTTSAATSSTASPCVPRRRPCPGPRTTSGSSSTTTSGGRCGRPGAGARTGRSGQDRADRRRAGEPGGARARARDRHAAQRLARPDVLDGVPVAAPVQLGNRGGTITLLNREGLKVDGVAYTAEQASRAGWTLVF